ncbi:MAG: carbon starvation protein A [Planctomycetes bacterium]|nr:carbon starvation protein A [Planctomycetota bacterium]MBI3846754.1 carbon starvation protein A [Planctomycetota bacterium]
MNVLLPLVVALFAFIVASRLYGGYVARALGLDPKRPTPAVCQNDGRDFVPTKAHIVFAHHFSAIAGAGPIIGPTLALVYGVVPALLWIVLGGIFLGAVHDFAALFVSVREKGRSIADIARKVLGKDAYVLFCLFTILMLVLVNSSFLSATAMSLTSKWPLDKLQLPAGQSLLRVVEEGGVKKGNIGGIASMSVVFITLCAPLLGWLLHKRKFPVGPAYVIAFAVCVLSIALGVRLPISATPDAWKVILSVYVLLAAGTPVWVILQPRDFINVQILYAGLLVLVVCLVIGGFSGLAVGTPTSDAAPSWNIAEGVKQIGFVWPMLFITIACGAISGFHSMVASGTTSKQVSEERFVRTIGYNGMLLESLLAVGVVLAVGSSLGFADYRNLVWTPSAGDKSNPILAFSLGIGHLVEHSLGLPTAYGTIFGILLVEGFVITTLDAAVRLNRYLLEELWRALLAKPPKILTWHWVNSGISVGLMWLFAKNPFADNWKLFGTGNQMLAAISFMAVTAWLLSRRRPTLFAVIPGAFMVATTFASLIYLAPGFFESQKVVLFVSDIVLAILSLALTVIAVRAYRRIKRAVAELPDGVPLPDEEETVGVG